MNWLILSYILMVISIFGLFLNARKNILCWPIWLISSVLWVVYFIHLQEHASIIMWIVYTGFNIYGWFAWKKAKQNL